MQAIFPLAIDVNCIIIHNLACGRYVDYHYTKIIIVRASVRADGSSPEASRPQRKKLCFFAKLKSRGSRTRPATALTLDHAVRIIMIWLRSNKCHTNYRFDRPLD